MPLRAFMAKTRSKIAFKHIFAYNGNMHTRHPAAQWEADSRQSPSPTSQLRLAAMAGHMRKDKVAARRAALIDLLADGRPHPREEIWQTIAARLGADCWGKLPQEALARDLSTLRRGGIRIAFSRRPGASGYYLQHPGLQRPSAPSFSALNWTLIDHIRRLPVPTKNERAFAAAAFALQQKQRLLAEQHPDWSPAQVDRAARRLVYGAPPPAAP